MVFIELMSFELGTLILREEKKGRGKVRKASIHQNKMHHIWQSKHTETHINEGITLNMYDSVCVFKQ